MKITIGEIFGASYDELNEEFLKELAKDIAEELDLKPYDERHDGPTGNYQIRSSIEEQMLAMRWAELPNGKLGMIFILQKLPESTDEDLGVTIGFRVEKFVVQLRDKKLIPDIKMFHGDTE